MRRSSGTSCMPACAIAVRRLTGQVLAVEHDLPERGATMPIRLLSVVLLPAPLRPSKRHHFVLLDAQGDVEQDVRVAVVAVQAGDFEQAHAACTPPR